MKLPPLPPAPSLPPPCAAAPGSATTAGGLPPFLLLAAAEPALGALPAAEAEAPATQEQPADATSVGLLLQVIAAALHSPRMAQLPPEFAASPAANSAAPLSIESPPGGAGGAPPAALIAELAVQLAVSAGATIDADALRAAVAPALEAFSLPTAAPPPALAAPPAPTVPLPPLALPRTVEDPAWAAGLGERVVWAADEGLAEAMIELHPEELGPIRIRIETSGNATSVNFQAAQASTRELLGAALPQLRELLSAQGLQLARSQVGSLPPPAAATARAASSRDGLPPRRRQWRLQLLDDYA